MRPERPFGADASSESASRRASATAASARATSRPLIGDVLTGTGLTLHQAAARLERGEPLPSLTALQRRLVEDFATR